MYLDIRHANRLRLFLGLIVLQPPVERLHVLDLSQIELLLLVLGQVLEVGLLQIRLEDHLHLVAQRAYQLAGLCSVH